MLENKDYDIQETEELSLDAILTDDFLKDLDLSTEKETEEKLGSVVESEPVEKKDRKREKRPTWQKNVLLYLHDLVYLLAAVILVFLLFFRVVVVSGTSMNNTLLDGDYLLLISDVFYRNPQQGDVIVASKASFDNGAPIVKRVIATEGQTVDIDFELGIVYVDGLALHEPYTLTPTNLFEGINFPVTVEEGCIFVMGDNRNDSKDSRNPQIGQIDCREVLGKVVFLFMPGTNHGEFEWDINRIGVIS